MPDKPGDKTPKEKNPPSTPPPTPTKTQEDKK